MRVCVRTVKIGYASVWERSEGESVNSSEKRYTQMAPQSSSGEFDSLCVCVRAYVRVYLNCFKCVSVYMLTKIQLQHSTVKIGVVFVCSAFCVLRSLAEL